MTVLGHNPFDHHFEIVPPSNPSLDTIIRLEANFAAPYFMDVIDTPYTFDGHPTHIGVGDYIVFNENNDDVYEITSITHTALSLTFYSIDHCTTHRYMEIIVKRPWS